MTSVTFARVEIVAFDIDGTLTDGRTTYLGPERGWSQTYSTRDGEAILHMVATGLTVVPLSRNRTETARARMEGLKLPLDFLGVENKTTAVSALAARFERPLESVLFVGDGREDAAVFALVGVACAVHDAHPAALAAAHVVLDARGGERVMEEISLRIERARGAGA
jgi:3-deoxy-D-manno-octulosonate 8-phosphate phosphatase (KDO 8-P phosphatase)